MQTPSHALYPFIHDSQDILSFCKPLESKADELKQLQCRFLDLPTKVQKMAIYLSKLHAAQLSTKLELEEGRVEILLRKDFNKHGNQAIDVPMIVNWQKQLLPNIQPGIRKTNVMTRTENLDEEGEEDKSNEELMHVYPNFKVAQDWTHKLLYRIHTIKIKGILQQYALAAFAQFHFLDMHPLVDGNGRISRLISHKILFDDTMLTVPMFNNRKTYIDTLILGRKGCDVLQAPLKLCVLMLQNTIEQYNEIFKVLESF